MKRTLVIMTLVLLALLLLFLPFCIRSSKPALNIRIVSLATNITPPGFEWTVAVPKPRGHLDAVLSWGLSFQATNLASVNASNILSCPEQGYYGPITGPRTNEESIMTWRYGEKLDSNKVYRVIGAYYEPGTFQRNLQALSLRVPIFRRLVPNPKPTMVTSAWFQITATVKPL